MILDKSILNTIDEYIDFTITKDIKESELLKISTMIDVLKRDDSFIDEDGLKLNIFEINHTYKIDSDDPVEKRSQWARRNAYLSALKKQLKRELVRDIVFIIVKTFNIKETSFYFFKHLSEIFLGRSVDKKFILENFSNVKISNNESKKIGKKRTGAEKIELQFSYNDYVYLEVFLKKYPSFSGSDFMKIYTNQISNIHKIFEGVKVNYHQMTEEEKNEIWVYIEALKEKEKIKDNIGLTVEKPEAIKRKRL